MTWIASFLGNINEDDWEAERWKFLAFPVFFVVDLLLSLLLYGATSQWKVTHNRSPFFDTVKDDAWSPSQFFSGLSPDNYHSSSTEIVLLWFVRVVATPLLLVVAVNKSSLKQPQKVCTHFPTNFLDCLTFVRNLHWILLAF